MTDPADLVAKTIAVAEVPSLTAVADSRDGLVWHSDLRRLAGLGEALRVELPGGLVDRDGIAKVEAALSEIVVHDPLRRPGTGPVAFASIPFDPTSPAHIVVPRTVWGCDDQGSWVTVVGPEGCDADRLPEPSGDRSPDEFALRPSMSHTEWEQSVREAVERIRHGALEKVVLARRVDVEANRGFRTSEIVDRLAALYPSCMVFAMDGFVGASPELLVGRYGTRIETHPLAGTVARSGDEAADRALIDALLRSEKDRWEHKLVVEALESDLSPLCHDLFVPVEPSVIGLRNVSHLGTFISGTLCPSESGTIPSALEIVARIHPTPAVAGTPTKAAIAHIQAAEGFDRERYAGPVGWMDSRGDGTWAVGIRSAQIRENKASMFAGVGVVADSDPRAELAETQLKLQALLAALVRP